MLKQIRTQSLFTVTPDINEATHWTPLEDDRWTGKSGVWSGVSQDKHYRLFYDKYDREYVIVNDRGQLSMIYLAHHGLYLIYEHCEGMVDNSIELSGNPIQSREA